MTAIQQFEFDGQTVDFDFSADDIMVNATEMAKIYNKRINDFFENSNTKSFIKVCLNDKKTRRLRFEKEEDLYISKQRTGTWMHRVLALKFAAWLDPDFEHWVFCTIDDIIFGTIREDVKAKAQLQVEKEQAYEELRKNPFYQKIVELEGKEKKIQGQISRQQKVQLDLFGKA